MTETMHVKRKNPGFLVQLVWFLLVGWWLGQLWMAVAWFLMATIVGIPIAIPMLNSLPKIIALREPEVGMKVMQAEGGRVVVQDAKQHPFLLRALYFVFIGLWLSAIWLEIAYALCLTIILMPVGFRMFDMTPEVLTLQK